MNEMLRNQIAKAVNDASHLNSPIDTANAVLAIVQPMLDKLTNDLAEAVNQGSHNLDLHDAIGKLYDDTRERTAKLEKFKEYVHDRLDKGDVPKDPEPENNAHHGCRIEGRLNWMLERILSLELVKNLAYGERNKLVAALSKLFPSSIERHPDNEVWEADWRWIVFIDLPTGQITYHIHDSELVNYNHLHTEGRKWDGHSTDEKYKRIAALVPGPQQLPPRAEHLHMNSGAPPIIEG